MTREQEQYMEGFMIGLTCQGSNCDYKRGSEAWENWWKGFRRAKVLGAYEAHRIIGKIYREYAE